VASVSADQPGHAAAAATAAAAAAAVDRHHHGHRHRRRSDEHPPNHDHDHHHQHRENDDRDADSDDDRDECDALGEDGTGVGDPSVSNGGSNGSNADVNGRNGWEESEESEGGTVAQLLGALPTTALSGVGRATAEKLGALGAHTIAEAARLHRNTLTRTFGAEQGRQLGCMFRGVDPTPPDYDVWRVVNEVPKSLQNEVAWGVRLVAMADAESLVAGIAAQVWGRLIAEGLSAGSLTVKIRYRRPGAGSVPISVQVLGDLAPPRTTHHAPRFHRCHRLAPCFHAFAIIWLQPSLLFLRNPKCSFLPSIYDNPPGANRM
jgi:hypothetical protein